MKIRTQLIVAFLLLSVLPLTGLVLYNYVSSQEAVRQAVEMESAEMVREMNGRMSGEPPNDDITFVAVRVRA